LEETLEGCISGVSNADCGSFVQSAHIPCYAAAEAQAEQVNENEAATAGLTVVKRAV
jgi:hypothetical protein